MGLSGGQSLGAGALRGGVESSLIAFGLGEGALVSGRASHHGAHETAVSGNETGFVDAPGSVGPVSRCTRRHRRGGRHDDRVGHQRRRRADHTLSGARSVDVVIAPRDAVLHPGIGIGSRLRRGTGRFLGGCSAFVVDAALVLDDRRFPRLDAVPAAHMLETVVRTAGVIGSRRARTRRTGDRRGR